MAYFLDTVLAENAQMVMEHVKGHRCGYASNDRTEDNDIKIIDARCIKAYRFTRGPQAPVKITLQVLDALNDGSNDLRSVQKARRILEAAGLKVELHDLERVEAARLRSAAIRFNADADAIDGGRMR
jgi:hypothetical protein